MKPLLSYLRVIFCLFVLLKETARVDGKELNKCHQPQNIFRGIFVGIPQHQKGYPIYVLSTQNIFSSHII